MTEEQVYELFLFAKAYYPYMLKVPANEIKAILSVWNLELKKEKYEDVLLSLRKYVRTGEKFFPGIGQLLEFGENSQNIKNTDALSKFREAVKVARSVFFDDPYIHKTIKMMGGWQEILNDSKEQMVWIEKEFAEKYEDLVKRQVKCDDIEPILYTKRDIFQLENGLMILEPKIIGDKETIKKWHQALENYKTKAIS